VLTRLRVRNFKRFEHFDIELGQSVVLIGPNNSGKTTALQALALWDLGMRQWFAKRSGKTSPKKRPGVTINRRDVASIPIPAANLLWRELHTRDVSRDNGKTRTKNVRIDVVVDGIHQDKPWSCGFEFDYSNEESFVCRPLRVDGFDDAKVEEADFTSIPDEANHTKVAFLPPMSGLSDREHLKQEGEINFLIGQGQTAQVLRNLCYNVFQQSDSVAWSQVTRHIRELFGVDLVDPRYVSERSEIVMQYCEGGIELDLSSAGRGLQQTLLLLAHLYANPNTALLLDEPDAHLEILRQRQIYSLLSDVGRQQNAQIISASHSEIVLNEAAGKGTVIAFVGKPHTINDKGSQVLKALNSIGWDQYYQAEETGWVLYLEGPSDLKILQDFAAKLSHPARDVLARPFVKYVATNRPQLAREHFFGLKEAKSDLVGIAIFDRIDSALDDTGQKRELMWNRREIENYLCCEKSLLGFATHDQPNDLFGRAEADRRRQVMSESIDEVTRLLEIDDKEPWSEDVKASDEVLDRVFKLFFRKLEMPLTFRKADYHQLTEFLDVDDIDLEFSEKLDAVCEISSMARPKAEKDT